MKLTPSQYAAAFYEAVSESKEQEKVLDNFVEVLRENNDLHILGEIEKEFVEYDRKARGIKTAEVTSARELPADQEKAIVQELNKHLDSEVELKKKVDEGILGGVVIRVEDEVIDGSLKGYLKRLKNILRS